MGADLIHEERQVDRRDEVNWYFPHVWELAPRKNIRAEDHVCLSFSDIGFGTEPFVGFS